MKHWEELVRVVFSGRNDIEEWRLADPARAAAKGYPREFRSSIIDDHGIIFVDVVVDETGRVFCHEVNGPNAVGSDALTGNSATRAASEVKQTLRRVRELGLLNGSLRRAFVTVHAHQHWRTFRTGGEYYPRVARFAEGLENALGAGVAIRGPDDQPGDESATVVVGDVPSVGARLDVDAFGNFNFAGRPVAFIGNPNLLWELVRLGRLRARDGRVEGANLRLLHAWRLAHVIHDKALQQKLFAGTGITPLANFTARTRAEALALTRRNLVRGPVVLKPNAGSGGAGVHVVVPAMSDGQIAAVIERVINDVSAKYGPNSEATVFPLRGFDFVKSTGYPIGAGRHLWDLRIAVEFEPGVARAYPVTFRLTPAPFDPSSFHENRDMWVSNVSGRDWTCLKSGLDDEALALAGVSQEQIELMFRASVQWLDRAWDAATRDVTGQTFEDAAEAEDPSFYPRALFRA
jgi:hypothetical protein